MEIIFGIVGSIVAVIIWESFLKSSYNRLKAYYNRNKLWKDIFDFSGDTTVYKSKVQVSKTSFRASDVLVEELLLKKTKNLKLINPEDQDLEKLTSNIIAIGSVRYNKIASDVQRLFDLNFEYIQQSYSSEPEKRTLKIVSKYGDEYSSSVDNKILTEDYEIDYGILFLGNVNNKKILWISGIHGIGTIGIASYFSNNPEEFNFKNNESGKGRSWLFRIKYKKGADETLNSIEDVYMIQEEKDCVVLKNDEKRKTLIFDFGNVIMFFDRLRAYRGIAHLLKLNYKDVQKKIENTNYLEELESGKISGELYYKKIMKLFPKKDNIEPTVFMDIFGDIFWTNKNMIDVLSQLKDQGLELILLSNTNEIHFQSIREHYQDILKLFDNKIILSYEVKSLKPNKKIYDAAIEVSDGDLTYKNCIFIDDKIENINAAKELGMNCITFHKHSQFIYELRKLGIYIE